MSVSASTASAKWQNRAANAAADYGTGAQNTTKDQAQAAIASKENYKAGLMESFTNDSYAKGLAKSGKAGWLKGITEKGVNNYAGGVQSEGARSKYATNSGKYDAARNVTAGKPRGPKGSAANIAFVTAVVTALRAVKKS